MDREGFSYSGAEFEALSQGINYYAWIIDMFRARLRGRVVEVGAGRGTFARRLAALDDVRELCLIEPDEDLYGALSSNFANSPGVRTFQGYFGDHDLDGPVDAVILVNVLEHIEDDRQLARTAWDSLRPGGALLLFVPAGPALFGTLDRAFDHFRRYERDGLRRLLEKTGFRVDRLHYVNAAGVLPWYVAGKVLRQRTVGVAQMKLYDRCVIPWISRIENRLRPPFGQSLLAIGTKPEESK